MQTNVLDYLEKTAAKHPDRPAFSEVGKSITFKELVEQSRLMAADIAKAAKPGSPVVVMLDKSCQAIVSFMAVVYAGCFYSFLDKTQPASRLTTIIGTLNPELIIADDNTIEKVSELTFDCDVLNISKLTCTSADDDALGKIRAMHQDINPLYCNFTSGSSGTPKGVVVSHRSVIDFIDVFTEAFEITKNDVIGNQAPFDFDVSVKDIYSGLKTGAEVVLLPKAYFTFLPKLLQLLDEKKVTTLIWAVSALCLISTMKGLEYLLPKSIDKVMFSGEVMPANHLNYWRKFYPSATFVNLYGPTEITCNCTYHIVDRDYGAMESIPIGIPFSNEKVFLLDEGGALVTGSQKEGELCVSGTAVALGYYNNIEKTKEVFVQNPINKLYNEIIYKTGDIAKYGQDGLLYFVGRKDFQIKHNGHRIELGEIESAISSLEGITRACVLYIEDKKRIISYYIGEIEQSEIIKGLKNILPDYMIPSEAISVKSLPLTKNGKLDRKMLMAEWIEKNK